MKKVSLVKVSQPDGNSNYLLVTDKAETTKVVTKEEFDRFIGAPVKSEGRIDTTFGVRISVWTLIPE